MKIFKYTIPTWLLMVTLVSALFFSGIVIGEIVIHKELNYGTMKSGEIKELLFGESNSTIDPYQLNVSITCIGKDSITYAKLKYNSDGNERLTALNLDGNTSIEDVIDPGEIKLVVKAEKMGFWNCSCSIAPNDYLVVNITG